MTAVLTPKIELGLGSTWQTPDASIVWTDFSNRLVAADGLEAMRGRSTVTDRFNPSEITGTWRNEDRAIDPRNAAGPHYGQLIAGVPVRITATPDGLGSRAVARGFLTGFPQKSDPSNQWGTVPLQAYGVLDKVARAKNPSSVYALEVAADAPIVWWRLQETGGDVMVDASGNGNDGVFDPGTTALPKVVMVYGEPGYIQFDGAHRGSVAFSDKVSPLATPVVIEAVCRVDKIDPGFTRTSSAWIALLICDGTTNGRRQSIDVGRSGAPVDDQTIKMLSRVPGAGKTWTVGPVPFSDIVHHLVFRQVAPTSDIDIDGVVATAGNANTGSNLPLVAGVHVGGLPDDIDTGITIGGLQVGEFSWQGPLGEIAIYNTNLSDARKAAHLAAVTAPWNGDTVDERIVKLAAYIGLPADRLNLEACQTILGPASFVGFPLMLDYCHCLEDSEDGRLFDTAAGQVRLLDRYWPYTATQAITPQVVLNDTPGTTDIPYVAEMLDDDDTLLANVADGNRQGGAEIVRRNKTSIGLYGEASTSRANLASASDAAVGSLLEHLVAVGATPKARYPALSVPLHKLTPAQQAAILDLDMGHRLTVKRTPQGVGAQIVLDFVVEGIKHILPGPVEWWVELYVSPAPSVTTFWKWGFSKWGVDTVWAY